MACPNCGYGDNPPNASFCEQCGNTLGERPAEEQSPPAAPASAAASPAQTPDWPYDAPTMELSAPALRRATWTCACGQANPDGEGYCESCGEARPSAQPDLAPGDMFAGFTVLERLGGSSYRVQAATPENGEGSPRPAVLQFGDAARHGDLKTVLAALSNGDEGLPLLPSVLASGNDSARGAYVMLESPPGEWKPLTAAPLAFDAAEAALEQLLRLADRAARSGRLLLVSPANVYLQSRRLLIQEPSAPPLPLSAPLLADPVYLPPELKSGKGDVGAWPASAYAAAATVHAAAGNALGYPRSWHETMHAFLSPEPADRPRSLDEALSALHTAGTNRFVSAHHAAFLTDIGLHHPVNQDAGGVWTWQRWDGTPVTLAVVADGVSAGEHSEDASTLTLQILHDLFERHWQDHDLSPDGVEQLLLDAGRDAHAKVSAMPYEDLDSANATTLVAVCLVGATAVGIWCGDSRAYGVTPEGCRQLTRDHSWVNIMVDSGRMSLEQARSDPRSHVIARWLGASEPAQADPGFDKFRAELAPGDRLLVCSDGLYMYFDQPWGNTDELVAESYAHGDDVVGSVTEMVQKALDRGGYDNITAVLVVLE